MKKPQVKQSYTESMTLSYTENLQNNYIIPWIVISVKLCEKLSETPW